MIYHPERRIEPEQGEGEICSRRTEDEKGLAIFLSRFAPLRMKDGLLAADSRPQLVSGRVESAFLYPKASRKSTDTCLPSAESREMGQR